MKPKFHPYKESDPERNAAIRTAYQRRAGEPGLLSKLGTEFGGLTPARIHQIVYGRSNREPKRPPK